MCRKKRPSHPHPLSLTSVEHGTALPSFRDRETFSLSSVPSFASMARGVTNAIVFPKNVMKHLKKYRKCDEIPQNTLKNVMKYLKILGKM